MAQNIFSCWLFFKMENRGPVLQTRGARAAFAAGRWLMTLLNVRTIPSLCFNVVTFFSLKTIWEWAYKKLPTLFLSTKREALPWGTLMVFMVNDVVVQYERINKTPKRFLFSITSMMAWLDTICWCLEKCNNIMFSRYMQFIFVKKGKNTGGVFLEKKIGFWHEEWNWQRDGHSTLLRKAVIRWMSLKRLR